MPTTYDVRLWKIERYVGKTATTYAVRWTVHGRPRKSRFATKALADSFRSELMTAIRRGEAFDVDTGRPVSMLAQPVAMVSWYAFACTYVDMKWPAISPKHRKSIAEALVTVTPAMLTADIDSSAAKALRSALLNWGFNSRRGSVDQPDWVTERLDWVAQHCCPIADVARPQVVRAALELIATKLDGGRAAGHPAGVKRANFSTALNYAIELGLLESNPVLSIKWSAPKSTNVVDRRAVVNPAQARALLRAVSQTPRSGHLLHGFFACLYYAGLRPEEAANLRESNLSLPVEGWGWITLDRSAPETDKQWSDSGRRRDERQLKHRAVGDVRRVPSAPELTAILRGHLAVHGVTAEGRLFRGERGGPLPSVTYTRIWARARQAALTPAQHMSPLSRRPYDLRHAAVSTWLSGGVAPTQVAEWAGHSVDVLLRIYAKCLDGGEEAALRRIDDALR